ncbi:hypothetical protein MNBD_GAMMA25-2088 [hydrothermal vent metagenome]|uniref:Tat (Twin-arginine translocation) pathway signal sequence domain protein n=1 Tax=hydrothermal vent metagenome TaxID=652676 RepID=A0A3B1BT00_9ZZZZ
MDRRGFIFSMSAAILASSSSLMALQTVQAAVKQTPPTIAGLTLAQWDVIALIQTHLLPPEKNSPGATEINALSYFQSVITHPHHNSADKIFLLSGLKEVEARAKKKWQHRFFTLNHSQRETILRDYEKTRDGGSWLIMLMDYLMEALLSDPVYGGNPKGIGWQWLQHTPGFPRPPFKQQALFA